MAWIRIQKVQNSFSWEFNFFAHEDGGGKVLRQQHSDTARKGKGDAEPQLWKSINKTFRWTQDGLQIFSKLSISTLQLQLEAWSHLQNICGSGLTADKSQVHLQKPLFIARRIHQFSFYLYQFQICRAHWGSSSKGEVVYLNVRMTG